MEKQQFLSENNRNLEKLILSKQNDKNKLMLTNHDSSATIKLLKEYITTLETRNKFLEKQNQELISTNQNVTRNKTNCNKHLEIIERIRKDNHRLIELMRKSEEFRLLGHLGGEITFLHSLGFFSEYDLGRIQVKKKGEVFAKTSKLG